MFGMSRSVGDGPDIAQVAALLAEPSRASMVMALAGDLRLPGTELARQANVSRSTASEHLKRLCESEIVLSERCGRHTYYRLAGPAVATAVEALAAIAPRRRASGLRGVRHEEQLGHARLCYDHLAGRLGVAVTDALLQRGLIADDGERLEVDRDAWDAASPLGVRCGDHERTRRPLARACVDWTVRRHHLAGSLGAAVTGALFKHGWIIRTRPGVRSVLITDEGYRQIPEAFDIDPGVLEPTAG